MKYQSEKSAILSQIEASIYEYQLHVFVDDQITRAIPQKRVPERQIL